MSSIKNRRTKLAENFRFNALRLFIFKERVFLRVLLVLFILAGVFYDYPKIAMWLGFMFAGYSAIANDSIQTIGTFLSSNSERKWWQLWIFIGGIFVLTMSIGWYLYDGDVSFGRLHSTDKVTGELKFPQPKGFEFLQLAAPLILLFITRMKMPVSTTFLLLSAFSGDSSGILAMTYKSLFGYFISFGVAILVWFSLGKLIKKFTSGEPKPYWIAVQWVVSGGLWASWLMQDAANIAVFLPRRLDVVELIGFCGFIFVGLGLLFYLRGDKIQKIINEKSEVSDVRGATVIDITYTIILLVFQKASSIPMSTTWVFLGLLAGREIAMTLSSHYETGRTMSKTLKLILRDIGYAFTGLIISILLAVLVNEKIQSELRAWIESF